MKIYFSHATSDYNSEYENKCLEIIKKKYPDYEIINPRDIKITPEDLKKLRGKYEDYIEMMNKYYFSEIDKCEVLISFKENKNEKYSNGVKLEVSYAEHNFIKTIEM